MLDAPNNSPEQLTDDSFSKTSARGIGVGVSMLVLVICFLAILAIVTITRHESAKSDQITDAAWQTYTNNEYHFSLSYPANWTVTSGSINGDKNIPAINLYPSDSKVTSLPFDHFQSVANVSIYPLGIPTEGVVGETQDLTLAVGEEVNQAHQYVLTDGTWWGAYITFKKPPTDWMPYGFMWARVSVPDLVVTCLRSLEAIKIESCDPTGGDVIKRAGSIDPTEQDTVKRIVASFHFLTDSDVPVVSVDPSNELDHAEGEGLGDAILPGNDAVSPTPPPDTSVVSPDDPVFSGNNDLTAPAGVCRPTGCSNQVCSDHPVATTCEWTAAYSCYASAICERQSTGECGWRETAELTSCLDTARSSMPTPEQMPQ
jgi:hypothetical protein